MTTPAAKALYKAQHEEEMKGKKYAVYNPHNKPLEELPVIFGFNDGEAGSWFDATLIAQDGTYLGGDTCSDEVYMRHDLGIYEGTRPDRHEKFKAHYPDGYRMDFVSDQDCKNHEKLQAAFKLAEEKL